MIVSVGPAAPSSFGGCSRGCSHQRRSFAILQLPYTFSWIRITSAGESNCTRCCLAIWLYNFCRKLISNRSSLSKPYLQYLNINFEKFFWFKKRLSCFDLSIFDPSSYGWAHIYRIPDVALIRQSVSINTFIFSRHLSNEKVNSVNKIASRIHNYDSMARSMQHMRSEWGV